MRAFRDCDKKVRFWHLTDKPTAPSFVAYWTNNGQRSVLTLDGYAAIDPKQTYQCDWLGAWATADSDMYASF
jgi:hypothetical protein